MENKVEEPKCMECGEYLSLCDCPGLTPEGLKALAEFPEEEEDEDVPF